MLYKNITIASVSLVWGVNAFATLPEFCNDPRFVCKEAGPNYVIVYPVSQNTQQPQNSQRPDTYYSQNENKAMGEEGTIDVDLSNLKWVAYGDGGEAVRSGRASGGKDFCKDTGASCKTVEGTFTIYSKGGQECKSTRFPVGKGGAPMPYCMFFHGGYALHGANSVPDYNASHGCVRIAPDDAQWLNENFVEVGITRITVHY